MEATYIHIWPIIVTAYIVTGGIAFFYGTVDWRKWGWLSVTLGLIFMLSMAVVAPLWSIIPSFVLPLPAWYALWWLGSQWKLGVRPQARHNLVMIAGAFWLVGLSVLIALQ